MEEWVKPPSFKGISKGDEYSPLAPYIEMAL